MYPDLKFEEKFLALFERDARFISKKIVSWDYQNIRKKRKLSYEEGLPSDFFSYGGPEDLTKWWSWFQSDYPDYFPENIVAPLVAKSLETDKALLQKLGLNYDWNIYNKRLGLNNVHDFLFPKLYPVPERNKIKTILDFGAGSGRQANLWTSSEDKITYVGMDAIVNSYCLQNLYYGGLGVPLTDYADSPDNFEIKTGENHIFHVPTWRHDLLPSNSFDMVMCVQVLPELNSELVKTMFEVFHRILKPGGMIYLRDHGSKWKPAGKIDTDAYLENHGFELEFKPYVVNDVDLHGVVRIFRKKDEKVEQSRVQTLQHKIKQWKEDLDALTGGRLRKLKNNSKS